MNAPSAFMHTYRHHGNHRGAVSIWLHSSTSSVSTFRGKSLLTSPLEHQGRFGFRRATPLPSSAARRPQGRLCFGLSLPTFHLRAARWAQLLFSHGGGTLHPCWKAIKTCVPLAHHASHLPPPWSGTRRAPVGPPAIFRTSRRVLPLQITILLPSQGGTPVLSLCPPNFLAAF